MDGTTIVALAGIGATLGGTIVGGAVALRLAKREHDHAAKMAGEARRQDRIAAAYTTVLKIAEETGYWAQLVRPFMDTEPPRPVPPLPDFERQAEAQVLLLAYGSRAVVEAFESWRDSVQTIIRADQAIGLGMQYGADLDEWPLLESKYRPAEHRSRRRLADIMASELGADDREPTSEPEPRQDEPSSGDDSAPPAEA